jgi:hypothetical protein
MHGPMTNKNFFWDSCVITALLTEEIGSDLPSILKYISDAKKGLCKIYTSTLSSAEVLPSRLKSLDAYHKFLSDLEGTVIPISPDPNIMLLAGRLRDIPYSKKANNKETASRPIDVPDAVMLATAIVLQEGYRVRLDGFHTFDNGKKRSVNGGRCVPLLSFETWCEELTGQQKILSQKVVDLPRRMPTHPNPDLPGI